MMVLSGIIFLYVFYSFLVFLLPRAIGVDAMDFGVNQHCGFYTEQNERITPCKCLGVWTKGQVFVEDSDNNRAYCHGIVGWIFIN